MIYCISDIHGELDKFQQMLRLIQFSDADHLYILGDVIDRGAMGVDILAQIMAAPNMTMLIGNHEQMCLDTLWTHNKIGARELWKHNGGNCTYRELNYCRTSAERAEILKFLANLPDHLDIVVNNRKFHLVHAHPGNDHETRIWSRPDVESVSPWADVTCVVGHTPTPFLTYNTIDPFEIWYSVDNTLIDIDCGCGNLHLPQRQLACLRLDDMQEFYC